jgi:hypothetical protein
LVPIPASITCAAGMYSIFHWNGRITNLEFHSTWTRTGGIAVLEEEDKDPKMQNVLKSVKTDATFTRLKQKRSNCPRRWREEKQKATWSFVTWYFKRFLA